MTARIGYDIYRGTANRTLRLATMPGAGLPAHVKRKDWVLMPTGKSPVHSDADRDVATHGYCFLRSSMANNAVKRAKKRLLQKAQMQSTNLLALGTDRSD